jgi:hypothetical protein
VGGQARKALRELWATTPADASDDELQRGFTEALEKNPDLKLPFVAPGVGTASGNHWTIVDMASDWNAVFLFQHAATGNG